MFKKTISILLCFMMVTTMIPLNSAYAAAPGVKNMKKTALGYCGNNKYKVSFSGKNLLLPSDRGPVYDNPTNETDRGKWYRDSIDKKSVIRPGKVKWASFGICVSLKDMKMLGAALKGQLKAESSIYYDNYKGDDDKGAPFIGKFDINGKFLGSDVGKYHDVSNWITNNKEIDVPRNAAYLIFGGKGERDGGFLNKNMDFNINNLTAYISDTTAPYVIGISADNTYIRQNKDKGDPFIYITTSEDVVFTGGKVKLTAEDSSADIVDLDFNHFEQCEFNYSNGDVKYKVRINIDSLKGKEYKSVSIYSLNVRDTFYNYFTISGGSGYSCNKRIDTKAPVITSGSTPNVFDIKDLYGISSVSKVYIYNSIKNEESLRNIGDLENQKIDETLKNFKVNIVNNTSNTGLFNIKIQTKDLASNLSEVSKNLFLISDKEPIKFILDNSNSMFNISVDDVERDTKNVLTNMTLKTDIKPEYLHGAEVYYKWSNTYDESILTKFNKNEWQKVGFKNNSNETNPITIPVKYETDGFAGYLKPEYTEGYLYIIPSVDDDTTTENTIRTGSMAMGGGDNGIFTMINSIPVNGKFVVRDHNSTGQNYEGNTAEAYYGALRNHKGSIGFDIDEKDNKNVSQIKYFISPAGKTKSYSDQGTIVKNSSGKYNIPIDTVSGKTGSYVVTVAVCSNRGDVSVQTINLNIECPIIGISNIMYNQATSNLDFTVTYNTDSCELKDIQLELGDKDVTQFTDYADSDNLSFYAITEDSVISKENWDAQIGDKAFIRTPFVQDEKDSRLIRADFRASLTNMEKAGDEFIKSPGAKRVHVKYISSNKVETVNNNVTVIKKSNLPPSIVLTEGIEGLYGTADQLNSENSNISISVEEPIVDLKDVKYDWLDSAGDSLVEINESGDKVIRTVSGKSLAAFITDGKKVKYTFADIPEVEGDTLYKPYYLAVYAENSAEKYVEKIFGPFNILNQNINDKRFIITASDKAVNNNSVLVAVDYLLYNIDDVAKADKLKVVWQNDINTEKTYEKVYGLSFVKNEKTVSLASVNVPYLDLVDTDGQGGTYSVKSICIYDSADESNILKIINPLNIKNTLQQYCVEINPMTGGIKTGANVSSCTDNTNILYGWTKSEFEEPLKWVSGQIGITPKEIVTDEKGSFYNSGIYLLVKAWNNIYRSENLSLNVPTTVNSVNVDNLLVYKGYDGSYYAKIAVKDKDDLDNIINVDYYDLYNEATSATAVKADNFYKISDTEAVGAMPDLVTSSGAIKAKIVINEKTENIAEAYLGMESTGIPAEFKYSADNRTLTLIGDNEYSQYILIDKSGYKYSFDENGKTNIYKNGSYLLLFNEKPVSIIKIDCVAYTSEDISVSLEPAKLLEGMVKGPVTATITLPEGSTVKDKYGVIKDVKYEDGVIVSAVLTKSAIYSFPVKFANNGEVDYKVNIDYIEDGYKTNFDFTTSSSAITYNPEESLGKTKENVEAELDSSYKVLNNNNASKYIFNNNGEYIFLTKDSSGNICEILSSVNWIDKMCPEPILKKYVWYDFNNNNIIDEGEKGSEIIEGYKTKENVIVEICFPHTSESDRPVKLNSLCGFTPEELSQIDGYAYKFIKGYKSDIISADKKPVFTDKLNFTDTLGNTLNYNILVTEIDRTQLLTQLNYSTTNYTNRDVVVSMSANRAVKRFDIVDEEDENGNVTKVEKDASPTYVFKKNGIKDFNYRQIEVVPGEEESGMLTANVTWIDKSVPVVKTEFDSKNTNSGVEIKFTIKDGKEQNAVLKYGNENIALEDSGDDRTGTYTVNENGTFYFQVINKYGNIGDVIVPVNNIDIEAPVITITGRKTVYIRKGDDYYDKGAAAYDNKDGDVTDGIKTSSNVNTSDATKGKPYEVSYKVSDSSGNTQSVTRYVYVLDIDSAVAVIEENVIDLKSDVIHDIIIPESGVIYVEFVGINGSYTSKYLLGDGYDNAYFKTNGSYMSKLGTITVKEGKYNLYVQDQERNTRIIRLNFVK